MREPDFRVERVTCENCDYRDGTSLEAALAKALNTRLDEEDVFSVHVIDIHTAIVVFKDKPK